MKSHKKQELLSCGFYFFLGNCCFTDRARGKCRYCFANFLTVNLSIVSNLSDSINSCEGEKNRTLVHIEQNNFLRKKNIKNEN